MNIDLLNFDRNKITSSANREILCSAGATVIPLRWGCEHIVIADGSIVRVNSNGDNGQPCLQPLLTFIGLDIFLLPSYHFSREIIV